MSKANSEVLQYQAYQYAIDAALLLGITHTLLEESYQIDRTTSWRIRKGQSSKSLPDYLDRLVSALDDKQNSLLCLVEHKSGKHLQADIEKIVSIDHVMANILRISSGLPPKTASPRKLLFQFP